MFFSCQQHQNQINQYCMNFSQLSANNAQFSPDWKTALTDIRRLIPNPNLNIPLTLFIKCAACGLYYSS